ncbi:MAG: DUF1345 domain-containing protein [Polyangiaceae bacterium]
MPGPPSLARFSPRHAHSRMLVALAAGATTAGLVSPVCTLPVIVLAGWLAGGVAMLAMAWAVIWVADARMTKARAAAEDPGRRLVYGVVVLTSIVSLFAAVALARKAQSIAAFEAHILVYLCLATVAVSWFLTHTAFTLRYAHLYYRDDDEGVGGIELPGAAEATYFDFAYFSFTLGMCFQVSDVTISSAQVRRTALLHGLLSFAYNTAILALVLNLVFGSL